MQILPLLSMWRNEYYLAGGTALALQIGHRDSVDFDFFKQEQFDVEEMIEKTKEVFKKNLLSIIQIEKNTLSVLVGEEIKISFMTYSYPLIKPIIKADYISLASIPDIACMKLSTIMQRSALKDYVDLYEIMHIYSLEQLLGFVESKYKNIDPTVILKALSYLEDIQEEPLIYKLPFSQPSLPTLKLFFQNAVTVHLKKITS